MTSLRREDVFTVEGRGLVVAGRVHNGTIRRGDRLWLLLAEESISVTVVGVGGFCRRGWEEHSAGPGDNAGLLITGVAADQIMIGQVIADVPRG